MKKIIIFGATGNVGIYLTEYLNSYLSSSEYEIIAVGTKKTKYFDRYNVKYYQVDISNAYSFEMLPRDDVYAVVQLAGMLPARMKNYEPEKYFRINTIGMLNILEFCRKNDVDRVLYAQTYADLYGYMGQSESLHPYAHLKMRYTGDHAVYCISKCAAIDLMESYYQEYGIKKIVFRLPNIYMYSPEQYYYVNGVKTIIPYRYLISKAIKGEDIELWGNPNKAKDIVYVKDLCQMFAKALVVTNVSNATYNVGTGVKVSMEEQVQGIIDVFSPKNKKSVIIRCPEKSDCLEYVMDIENAKMELGYEPKYDYLAYLKDYKEEMNSDRFDGLY